MSPGMKLWDAIVEVIPKDLLNNLPGGLRGYVRAEEASDIFLDSGFKVLNNGIYKSVEHRAVVNFDEEQAIALFFYPRGDIPIAPAKELVTPDFPPLYRPISFNKYISYKVMKDVFDKS